MCKKGRKKGRPKFNNSLCYKFKREFSSHRCVEIDLFGDGSVLCIMKSIDLYGIVYCKGVSVHSRSAHITAYTSIFYFFGQIY